MKMNKKVSGIVLTVLVALVALASVASIPSAEAFVGPGVSLEKPLGRLEPEKRRERKDPTPRLRFKNCADNRKEVIVGYLDDGKWTTRRDRSGYGYYIPNDGEYHTIYKPFKHLSPKADVYFRIISRDEETEHTWDNFQTENLCYINRFGGEWWKITYDEDATGRNFRVSREEKNERTGKHEWKNKHESCPEWGDFTKVPFKKRNSKTNSNTFTIGCS